jgi:antitoxin component YwqK of YwqJK toxin-antitoxin module
MKSIVLVFQLLLITSLGFSQTQGDGNKTDSKGRKQGKWVKFHEDTQKKRYEGAFENDIPIGKFTYYYLTGEVSAVTDFMNDNKTAYTRMYHLNGKVMAAGKYTDKMKDSTWLSFNDRKEIMSKENYVNGKLNGENIVYYPSDPLNGKVKKFEITNYEDGLKHGNWIQYYSSGKVKAEGVYKDGNFDGNVKWFFSSGKVEIEGFYKHAVKYGYWKYYEDDGTFKNKVYYRDGQVIEDDVLERHLERLKKAKAEQKTKL